MASAAPAIERAKAKLDALFDDPRLPRATPSDDALYGLLRTDNQKFTFPDEQRLKLAYNIDGGNITPEEDANILEEGETISTAWRFPVDTDGDGSFDSFTLYNIVFRSPARDPNNGAFAAARSPLDATAPPMDDGFASPTCAAALSTSAKLVTQAGWYKSGSKLAKSFFVYTATVPIADLDELNATIPSGERGKYETYTGSPGFSALEYQQDRARIPLSNNAVVFEDDLAVVAGDTLRLNGSMITNSNLFTTTTEGGQIELYQVSADESCFYQPENSKISVGGHIINSAPLASQPNGKDVRVDLFVRGAEPNEKKLKQNEQSAAGESPQKVLYNSQAYTRRLNHLTTTWINGNDPGSEGFHQDDPSDVQTRVKEAEESEQERVRSEALFAYFQERTRRVPFDEVAVGVEE
ncbi:MAG: hormogonium polysaccharide biosynthesis protein HpsA, partial [Coleofasciculus sp. C2-GNP5-27]